MINRKVVQDGDNVFGVYESPSTYIMIHYIAKSTHEEKDKSTAFLDIETMFNMLEDIDRRKGNA